MPAPDAIFRPAVPGEAVGTLVLIENSQAMTHLWSDLRDHHLPTLLGTMRLANPIVPIQVLWLITSPVNNDDSPPSRNDKELPNIRFDMNPSNKISPAIVKRGINLLASTFQNQTAARHLILVAASPPSEAYVGMIGSTGSEWQQVVQKLQQEQIHLHIIHDPAHNVCPYTDLFYDALRRQRHEEIFPWFPVNSLKYQFRLAGTPMSSTPCLEFVASTTMTIPYTQIPDLPDHPPLLRNYTYPPDPVSPQELSSSTSAPQEDVPTPCLVTRLQKMHGLSKKRIHASQLPREPFVREERIRDKYPQVPTPLSIPASSHVSNTLGSPSADTRIPSKSKTDRVRRLSAKSPLIVSALEPGGSLGSRSSWSRRNSRATVPTDSGSGSYPSSPTSVSSYLSNSSVPPTPQDFDSLTAGPVNLVSAPWEPLWLRDQTEQYSSASTLNVDSPPLNPEYDRGDISPSYSRYPALQPLPFPLSLTTQEESTNGSVSLRTSRSNGRVQLPAASDDGEKPFILCPEYEAAATARFQAIFQTLPGRTAVNPSTDSGSANDPNYYASLSGRPPTRAPLTEFSSALEQYTTSQSLMFPHMPGETLVSQISTRSSSLEGWDGQYPM